MAGEPVVTPHTDTPKQAAQTAAAATETKTGRIPAGETDAATATIGDVDPGTTERTAPLAQPDAPQPKMPSVRSLNDDKRNAITARFRQERAAESTTGDDADQLAALTRSGGLPPEMQPQPEPAPQPAPEPEPALEVVAEPQPGEPEPEPEPQPQTVKLKVNGKEIEVPLEEAIARAQVAYASDTLLDEAKAKAREASALLDDVRHRAAARPAPDSANPPVQPTATPGSQQPAADTANQGDPFGKLVETLQFGDPEEAKRLLQQTIGTTAAQMVEAGLQQARFRDEGARSAKVIKDFEAAHPDVAKDKYARAAIEQDIYDQQADDLQSIGIDPNTIRQDGLAATPADIANVHRWFRVEQGMTSLKSPSQMLETATTRVLEWKGIKPTGNQPAVPAPKVLPKAAPVVDVTVDRSARRQAIPQQPSPTAAPRPMPAATPAPQTLDGRRSSIVQAMQQKRALMRNPRAQQ